MTSHDLEILYNQYAARLMFFAQKMIHDREAAEDIVMIVFTHVWEKDVQFPGGAKNWLYHAVKNKCLDFIRHGKLEKRVSRMLTEQEWEPAAIESDYIGMIYEYVKEMPEKQQEIFLMTYRDGMKSGEIAAVLGISPSTVTTQRQRAVDMLRKILNQKHMLMKLLFLLLLPIFAISTAGSSGKQNKLTIKCDSLQRLVDSLSLPVRHHITKRPESNTWILYVYRQKIFNGSNGTFTGQAFLIEKDTLPFIPCEQDWKGELTRFRY